jgi:hypothetical protein
MSKEYRKATDWELSTKPLEYAEVKRENARECGNALEAARYSVAAVNYAIDARRRGQAIDTDSIDPEDMLTIKNNAVRTIQVAMGTLHLAKRALFELCRRMEREREDIRPAAVKAKRKREAKERVAALVSRGPYSSICGTYRACKS